MTARPQLAPRRDRAPHRVPRCAPRCAPRGALALPGLALALALALGGCRRAAEPGPGALRVDDAAVARHVRYETGLAPGDLDRAGLERLRADLLGEALLARGAERESFTAPPAAVAAEASRLKTLLGTAPPGDDVLAEDARRRLLARLYDERVVVPLAEKMGTAAAGAGAAAPGADAMDDAPRPSSTEELVLFRQVRCESRADAQRVVRRIARGEAFEDVAREVSTSPDHGRLLRRAPRELPEPVAAALGAAQEGAVTGPVETNGAYYVLALEGRVTAEQEAPDPAELRLRGRRRAHDEARARKIAELAREEGIAVPPQLAEDTAP